MPDAVEVLTDSGSAAEVEVNWDYSNIDFTKYGKYVVTGTLVDFPNPNNITPTVNIYVGKAQNLLDNPSFESDLAGWYFRGVNPSPGRTSDFAADGRYAAHTGNWSVTGVSSSVGDSRNLVNQVGAKIEALGGGQFYYSISAMSSDANLAEGAQIDVQFNYKTKSASGTLSSLIVKKSEKVALSNKEFTSPAGVVTVPANTAWVRLDLYAYSQQSGQLGKMMYVDDAKIIPINVTIPKDQEPEDVAEIIEEIPVRAVIKDYNTYVGEDWQSALGLPQTVRVRTSGGKIASVGVNWNFENLKLDKEGKYILVGTLDDSAYPNPLNLSVTQTIYIRAYKNMISNGSFEGSYNGWYIRGLNPSPSVSTDVAKLGKYSAKTGTISTTGKSASFADTRNLVEEIGAAIAMQGAGQYYYSAWAQLASKTAVSGMQLETRMGYKTIGENGELSSLVTKIATKAELNNKSFVQSAGILELPANIGWGRLDLYVYAQSAEDINTNTLYFDYAEIVPLNVIVEQHEGSMVQVETVIPDRQIIKNYPDYIGDGYTDADLMFPETVKVRSTTGDLIDVGVRWDYTSLNLTKTGYYTVYGVLEDMKLANPNALTVKQNVRVVEKKNLFANPGFEDDLTGWSAHYMASTKVGISSPKHGGDFSILLNAGRLNGYTTSYLQAFYNGGPETVGQQITKTGGGKYAFSAWVHGSQSSMDIDIQLRMLYRSLETGDKLTTITAPMLSELSLTEFRQVGDILTVPDDIYWARMDLYMYGSVDQLRQSEIYLDDMELIPLNVEIPNLTDIIDCETTSDVYVHEGTTIKGLKLPEALQVIIKNGQKFDLGVTWDTSSFDPNQLGEQIIVGSLNLGKTYKNPKGFVPTVRVVVREKGKELRDTIYIANHGNETNDGLSPDAPKSDISKIPTYLKQGMNVKLNRGDVWYIPTGSITLSGIYATEDAPLTLGAYGEGELPIIGFLRKIEDSEWKLVDEKRNVYAVDVSSFGQKYGISVHRCFVNGEAYTHMERSNYVSLDAGEYCSYNNTLYIRMPESKAPNNVEITPYGTGGHRLLINNVTNLNIEYIHFKGSSAISSMMYIDAPTENLKFKYCSITQCFYYIMMWETDDEQIHYKPEISNCYIDANFNEREGMWAEDGSHWAVSITEGITMRDGVDGAWIHHNTIRNMSHAFIAIESTAKASDYDTTGVRNCIIEDNILEGGNAGYARAFNICGGYNLTGVQMCRDNTYRRNRCYDMTTSSHLYGENNLVYSNLFSYVHCTYKEDGTLLDGKTAQPWGFDTIPWGDHVSIGNMLINNTFYNVSGAIAINDQAHTVYNNLYANNLICNWTSDTTYAGAIWDNSIDLQYVYNNGVYSTEGRVDHFIVDEEFFTAEDVNNSKAGYSGNIYGNPKFVNADLSNMEKGARYEFVLSNQSPFRYAGISLYNIVYQIFPAWERLMAEYTDINGVVYLAESPSIGAYSFSERISGDVAEVGKLFDILARPGATVDQLNLPDAVSAVNDQGIDVMLLTEWNTEGIDFSKPGTVTLTAALRNGPHTDLNINDKVATINVNIKDKLELLSITTVMKKVTVLYGTSFEDAAAQLPQTLDVVEETGYQERLPVTWACANYDPLIPGSYTFKCVLPDDMISNAREFPVEVEVRLLHEITRGTELLINPDFIDGYSADPWKVGWGTGNFRITTDPQYVYPGETSAAIVTMAGRYGSIQQDVLGQMQLMGEGKYLFVVHMRAFDRTLDASYAALKIWGPKTFTIRCRAATDIGTDWVTYSAVMDVTDVAQATEITFHTSTGKSQEDVDPPSKSYIISGCSLIYLGNTDKQVTATTDMLELEWNTIRGENTSDKEVTSNLNLPAKIGSNSSIVWSSSDEAVIANDGTVTMGRVVKIVTLTATITHTNGTVTVKRFAVTVPRDPNLAEYTATLSGEQTVKVGDEFKVTVSVNSANVTAFNAFRFTMSFNASNLEYVGLSDTSANVEIEGGRLVFSGSGAERPISDTFTVVFKAKKSGITEVKLVMVEMDLNENASLDQLPTMNIAANAAMIDIQKADDAGNEQGGNNDTNRTDSSVVWIVIGIVAVLLIAGGIAAVLVIRKKKQNAGN
ncbi:MAG: hypothetical protein E7447_05065 [Ruminococcaceae bacterium]|nr:hypothetical protein [Oscillospiraceae bacterium]